MKKRLLSWVVIAMFSVMTAVMCSACSLDGLFGGSAETYTVTYYVDGEVWKTVTATDGELIVLPNYESETEIFNGWKLNGQGDAMNGIYTVNGNTIFIADFKESVKLTFYVNNEVWKVDYTEPGQLFFLPVVADSVSYKFNGWKINGQGETLNNSCTVEEATVFVADVTDTGKRLLTYIVDGSAWKAVEVNKDTNVALDTVTETNGRTFKGWKVNGEGTTYTNYALQEDTVLVAYFTCQLTFNNDGNISNKEVEEGTEITLDTLTSNTKTFDGWKINGQGNLLTGKYTITKNTNFVAHYVCTVTFNNNGKTTTKKVDAGSQITLETLASTSTKGFMGWKINGQGNALKGNYTVNNHITFVAIFADIEWVATSFGGLNIRGDCVWTGSNSIYYSEYENQYVYQLDNWYTKSWSGYGAEISGECIWKNSYGEWCYSYGTDHYVLGSSNNWQETTWKELTNFNGLDVWRANDGTVYYSSGTSHYLLNGQTWVIVSSWNGMNFYGRNIWTKDDEVYCSDGNNQYQLIDGEWIEKSWGSNLTNFEGQYVWNNGVNYYYSYKDEQYILNTNGIWVEKEWCGFTPSLGYLIWTDCNGNYYYSAGSSHYKLKN